MWVVASAGVAWGQEGTRQVTLEGALELARANAPSLVQRESELQVARYQELSAWGAFLPSANLSYSYSNASTGRLDPTGQAITTTSYSAQLGGSVDLFRGLRRFSDLRGSKKGVEASLEQLRAAEYQTAQQVKVAFYNAVANRELVRVEGDRVKRQEDQLSFVQQQVDLGRATRSDLLRSQVDLNNARVALLTAQNAARASTYALAEAVGVTEPLMPEETAELGAAPLTESRAQLLQMALARAPSLGAARAQAQASEAAVASAKASYLPSLSFRGGWAWANTEYPPQSRSWSLGLSGSLPLFDGFSRETQLYRARAQLETAQAQERATELSLRTDLDAALGTIEAALASIDLAQQTVDLSREDLRVTQERYRLGLATILDLQSAQITLRQAEVDLIRKRFDYQIGLAQLEALLGTDLRH
jgi:outer membrane protein TolC